MTSRILPVFAAAACLAGTAAADTIIDFSNATLTEFVGDGVGDTASLIIDGQATLLTTRTITPGGTLNAVGVGLGVDDGAGDAGEFDPGEAWGFDFDIDTRLTGFRTLNLNNTESVSLQSDGWIGLAVTPGHGSVAFSSATGTFTLTGSIGAATDDWTLAALTGGADILTILSGTDVLFTNSGGDINV